VFDRIVSIVMFLIGAAVVYFSQQMPKPIFAGQLGPGVFPTGIGLAMMFVSGLLFWESRKKANEDEQREWDKSLLYSIALLVLYVILFKPLGFIISSCFLILAMGWTLGARKWIPLLAVSILFPGTVYLLFTQLGIALP